MLNDLAEGVGFEPTLGFPLSLISSQVPSTTQPPFRPPSGVHFVRVRIGGKLIRKGLKTTVYSIAKREETRAKHIASALEWMAAGKSRNWRYERC